VAEQRAVGVAVADRQVVDADEPHAPRDQRRRAAAVQADEVGAERVALPQPGVRCAEQDAVDAGGQVEGGDRRLVDRPARGHGIRHDARADERVEVESLGARAVGQEVARRVDVRPRVRAEVEACDVGGVATLERLRERDPHPGVARVDRHARPDRHRDVDEGAAGSRDRRRWCRRVRGRPPSDRPSRAAVNPPNVDGEQNPALCEKSRPFRNVVVDVQECGRMACLSGADRPPHPAFGTRKPSRDGRGRVRPRADRPPLSPHSCPEEDRHGPVCVPARWTRVERWPVASARDRRAVTSTMPYVRCIRCGVRCFSAARWSNVDQCGVCGADLPRRPVESCAAVPRVHPARTASLALPAALLHERGADMAWGGAGAMDRPSTRRVAARTARSA